MRIEGVSWKTDHGGYPYVELTLDGRPAMIYHEQNPPKAGVVILDPEQDWADQPPIIIPADPALGRGELVVNSATDDPAVVQLWWDMHRALQTDDFTLGPRPVTKARTFVDNTAVIEVEPDRQQTTVRLRDVLSLSFGQVGSSLTPEMLRPLLDEYHSQPNDERHPIDVWMELLTKQKAWLALPDISTEMAKVFDELYAASVVSVLHRFINDAYTGDDGQLEVPRVTVQPDPTLLVQHAEEVLDMVDEGTLYFVARYLSEHPNVEVSSLISGIHSSIFQEGGMVLETRIQNINNMENAWVTERCALDLLATLGAKTKEWRVVGEPHSPHCLANSRRGAVPLDALYSTDYGDETLTPPSSPSCTCQLFPGPNDVGPIVRQLTVTKTSVVPDLAVVWIDVPGNVAGALGLNDAGVEVLRIEERDLSQMNDALNSLAYMIQPFGVTLSGEVGVVGDWDVAWILVTPHLMHLHDTLLRLLSGPLEADYRPYIRLGPAGKTNAEFQLDFGDPWFVFGVRLCVRIAGKDDCRYYPFLQPT